MPEIKMAKKKALMTVAEFMGATAQVRSARIFITSPAQNTI
jgi:hypothetical protein